MAEPRVDASIVVCTRNRAAQLGEVCEAICGIHRGSHSLEVILVDNGSSDGTAELVSSFQNRKPELFIGVFEGRPGLSLCRNRGIEQSQGEVVIFLDDDALPCANWLPSLISTFASNPRIMVAGGPIEPRLVGDLPEWFKPDYLPYLSAWERGDSTHDLYYNEYPRGANIAFRRSAFQRYGGFLAELGRRGRSLRSGEETELCLRVERGGDRIVYVPEARVEHVVHADRLTPSWLRQRFRAQGKSEALINWRHGGWGAMSSDLGLYLRNAVGSFRAADGLVRSLRWQCYLNALLGYGTGVPIALSTVARYRPRSGAAWVPRRGA